MNDLINESSIPKGEMSNWINDKIKKGVLYERNPPTIEESKELLNLEVEI